MEWRCASCGEPHRRNNPPCRECGHLQFERAVVRLEWECDDCGTLADSDRTACERCGGESLTRLHERTAQPDPEFDDEVRVRKYPRSQGRMEQFVWECRNCGKNHQRNSPPCSRCGHTAFEKVPFDPYTPEEEAGLAGRLRGMLGSATGGLGLLLAAVGGLVMLYGGFVGAASQFFEVTGRLPPDARLIVFGGLLVGVVGAGLILFSTRSSGFEFEE